MFIKGIGVIVPLFDVTLCLLMLHSLRLPRFPYCLLLLVKRRMMINSSILFHHQPLLQFLLPSSLLQHPFLLNLKLLKYIVGAKTLQSQVQHRLLCHQIKSKLMIFRLLSIKVNVSVLTQSLCLFPITICLFPFVPLLHSWILSLFLTL